MTSKFIFDENWINTKVEEIQEQEKCLKIIEEQLNVLKNGSMVINVQVISRTMNNTRELLHSFERTRNSLQNFKENITLVTKKSELEVEKMRNFATKLFS